MGVAFSQLVSSIFATFASVPEESTESINLFESLSLYSNLFHNMTWLAGGFIVLAAMCAWWMNRVTVFSNQ